MRAALVTIIVLVISTGGLGCKKKEDFKHDYTTEPSPIPSKEPSIGPDFSLGLTPPVRLLKYQHQEHYPTHCRRTQILEEIKRLAEKAQCGSSEIAIGDAPTRLITCDLPSRSYPSCPTQYVALIWQERWTTSTENYNLEMYARVKTQCGLDEDFGTFRAPDRDTKKMTKISEDVNNLLKSCK